MLAAAKRVQGARPRDAPPGWAQRYSIGKLSAGSACASQ
jgi:hypothetical protein